MSTDGAMVFLVDDDPQVRDGLSRLLRSHGWRARAFDSAEDFLQQLPERAVGCLLLDIRMPGMSGVDLHDRLNASDSMLSVIYLTGHSTVPACVRAMKHGAYDFLEKPATESALLSAIEGGTAQSVTRSARTNHRAEIHGRLKTLTPREHEVMSRVISGLMNKQIADELQIALKTVKVHRGRMMAKMGVRSIAQLMILCEDAGIRV